MKRLLCLLLLCGCAPAAWCAHVTPAPPLPGDSVYQLDLRFTTQNGAVEPLVSRRGRPQLVSMFYTSCTMICPLIIDTLRLTRQAVAEPARDRLDVLAVSFDPAHDGVTALRDYARVRRLDPRHWTLARATPLDTRQLAALLSLQYRALPDGEFSHSSELILLDSDGRIAARSTVIGKLDPAFVAAVRKAAMAP